MDTQLTTTENALSATSFDALERIAGYFADAGIYGFKKPSQVMSARLIAHETNKTLAQLMTEKHFFEDGKIADKSSYIQATFEKIGSIIWHVRTDEMVAASFFREKAMVDDKAQERAIKRLDLQWKLDLEKDPGKRSALSMEIAKVSRDGEATIIRTFADAYGKGIALNSKGDVRPVWKAHPRQMLTARVVSEGVNLIAPGLAQFPTEDEVTQIQITEQVEKAAKVDDDPVLQEINENYQAKLNHVIYWKEQAEMVQDPDIKKEALANAEREQALADSLKRKLDGPRPEPTKPAPAHKIVDATNATVLPPQKPAAPVPPIDPDPLPEKAATRPTEPPAAPPKPKEDPNAWMKYKLKFVKNPALKDKALGTMDREQIGVLFEKRAKMINDPDPAKAHEARMIVAAEENHKLAEASDHQ